MKFDSKTGANRQPPLCWSSLCCCPLAEASRRTPKGRRIAGRHRPYREHPPKAGELTYALATSPDTLDPHRTGLAVAVRVIRTIYDSLVVQLPDNTIKPWLATEWTISDDGLSYTFKLRGRTSSSRTERRLTPRRSSSTSTGFWTPPPRRRMRPPCFSPTSPPRSLTSTRSS
ncbi:hypothetical protein VQ056_15070 [Paenibacillus sp. JTLBN-2024]